MPMLFMEREILKMIAEGKEPPAIAQKIKMPLYCVHVALQNIERKTLSHTWQDLVELGKAFQLDASEDR